VWSADGGPAANLTAAECAALYHRYARTYDHSRFPGVFAAIRDAAEREPEDAEILACLSRLWVDVHRYGYDSGLSKPDPLATAADLARRSVALAPNSSGGHVALGLAYWLCGDVDGSIAAFNTALALNPNDTEALAELGFRHALRTEWDIGIPMLDAAYRRNPAQPGPYRLGLGLWHLAHGRFEAALAEARKTEMTNLPHGAMVAAAAAIRLGMHEEAAVAVDTVKRTAPAMAADPAAWLAARSVHPTLIETLVQGLSDAGLAIPPPNRGRDTVEAAA
jgi:adenylate cyclase